MSKASGVSLGGERYLVAVDERDENVLQTRKVSHGLRFKPTRPVHLQQPHRTIVCATICH